MNRYAISIVALLASCCTLSARTNDSIQPVKINGLDVYRQNDNMNVEFVADFSDIRLKKNHQIVYTPVLTTADGSERLALDKIVLNGRNVAIVEERSPKTRVQGAAATLRRKNGAAQSFTYSTTQPYQPWMDDATLYLAEDVCGCGDLQSQNSMLLTHFDNTPIQPTDFVAALVEPQVEQPKIRHEKGSAYVDFVVNQFDIRPSYRNNHAEIGKIISSIDVVKNDGNVSITDITIHGYASPEGSYAHNTYLAANRTKALTDYVRTLYFIPANTFKAESTPENWDGLRAFVSASHLTEKQGILDIIDNPMLDPDSKEMKIKADYPVAYTYLLQECYPALRRSDYVISYVVRPFTAEEALKVMKVNPQQVSLYEMFWAAQSLGVNSDEYNDIILLAAKTYPDEPLANYNAAVVALRQGNYMTALNHIDKVPESAKTQNIRGVIALNRGYYDAAQQYFQSAVEQGMPEAAENIKLIERMTMLNKQNR
ncbi:MAG: DUF3868 domain-containing protein [Prevotellaceae bacterium]|nr:DUF3868 domain-containing protein [Prevotellaceae bacterium]